MKPRKILSVILALLMAVSMLPSLVFAEEPSVELDGRLKIQGIAAVGSVLSADYTKVTPEGVTDDDVTFQWSRIISEDEDPVELGTEKEYTLAEEDLGYKILLKITGNSELGLSGELEANTVEIVATPEEAPEETTELTEEEKEEAAREAAEASGEETSESITEVAVTEEPVTEAPVTEELVTEAPVTEEPVTEAPVTEAPVTETAVAEETVETQTAEEVPEGDEIVVIDPQENTSGVDSASTDSADTDSAETVPSSDSAGNSTGIETDDSVLDIATQDSLNIPADGSEEISYSAQVSMDDESGVLDFGTAEEGTADALEAKYVTITNTGSGTLNFESITPEHFMVEDVTDPLEPGQSVTLWIRPRTGVTAGVYADTITYTTKEGAVVSFEAALTVTEVVESSSEETSTVMTTVADDSVQLDLQNAEESPSTTATEAATETTTQAAGDDSAQSDLQNEGESQTTAATEAATQTVETTTAPTTQTVETTTASTTQIVETTTETTTAAPEVVNIGVSSVDFGTLTAGYIPTAQEITLTNNSSTDASITISGNNSFDVLNASGAAVTTAVIGANSSLTLKIQPKAGLAAGSYSDVIIVTGGAQAVSYTAAVTVAAAVYGLSVTPTSVDFGSAEAGYTQPTATTVTVTNTGNTTINLTQPTGTSFIVGSLSATSLAAGGTATFTVQPNAGLSQGTYAETITVTGDNAQASLTASFIVTAEAVKLTGITSPAAITGLKNGTKKSADGLSLPSKVTISTNQGEKKASVSWDVKSSAYSVKTTEKQVFTVKGTVTLPDGVTNPDNISLVTSVKVTVNARTAIVADSENNTISGISSAETYTTETKITITATGAGMDNTDPGSGDIRYIPVSWKVLETRNWDSAPYTATFRMGKGGSYTLEVVFNQQKYDGSTWQNTGSQDTKQVSFTVADVTGADLTPAVTGTDQTNAVQTGDDTPIMGFVIVLVIAVVVIVGIVIYRKKKK